MQVRILATTSTVLLLSAVSLAIAQTPASARPESVRLSPAQAQHFSRDLTHLSAQDFFRQGQEKFEKEVRIITEKRFFPPTPILKINGVSQVERDLSPVNNPKTLLD